MLGYYRQSVALEGKAAIEMHVCVSAEGWVRVHFVRPFYYRENRIVKRIRVNVHFKRRLFGVISVFPGVAVLSLYCPFFLYLVSFLCSFCKFQVS